MCANSSCLPRMHAKHAELVNFVARTARCGCPGPSSVCILLAQGRVSEQHLLCFEFEGVSRGGSIGAQPSVLLPSATQHQIQQGLVHDFSPASPRQSSQLLRLEFGVLILCRNGLPWAEWLRLLSSEIRVRRHPRPKAH